ncbi:MAG: class I SAM-dependent methyltransferase [Ilumatobacter sp.]|nr:class I SAM-dependent methyltransferase [Ilumatobacter sp.]
MSEASPDADQNRWLALLAQNPDHSAWYIQRFMNMAAEGRDLGGEARLIDAMASRGARILDAGCGTGRVGALLAASGHHVVGVDLDPELIDAAREACPEATWLVGDLAELDLPAHGINDGFDLIVSAGNVMTFLAPSTRRAVLARLRDHLRDGGRLVVGFGRGRDYGFAEFFADVEAGGLDTQVRLATWDLRPFTETSDFLVAILGRSG